MKLRWQGEENGIYSGLVILIYVRFDKVVPRAFISVI